MDFMIKTVLYHLQLLPQGADGSLLTGHQFLQVLVPQLLPRSALSRALTTSLQFGLQVDLCRFAAAFSRFLDFTSHHLTTETTECYLSVQSYSDIQNPLTLLILTFSTFINPPQPTVQSVQSTCSNILISQIK